MSNGNTRMENEIVLLKSITGLIDDMVNHSMILIEKFDDGKLVKPHHGKVKEFLTLCWWIFCLNLIQYSHKTIHHISTLYVAYPTIPCSIQIHLLIIYGLRQNLFLNGYPKIQKDERAQLSR